MESASMLSALAQPFGVGAVLKSWFGLFGLDCLHYFWKLIRLLLRKTCMLQLFLILLHPENYLNVNFS